MPIASPTATISGSTLTLDYNQTLDAAQQANLASYQLTVNGVSRSLTGLAVSSTQVVLTLGVGVSASDTVLLGYTDPAGDTVYATQTSAGVDFASLSDFAVANNTPANATDYTQPTLVSASFSEPGTGTSSISFVFSEDMQLGDSGTLPVLLKNGTTPINITSTTVAGSVITVNTDTLLTSSDTVVVSQVNSGRIHDLTGSWPNEGSVVIGGSGATIADASNIGDWNTFVAGNAGNDNLTGSDSREILVGGAGSDTIDGGWGNDAIFLDDGGTRASDTVVVGINGGSNPNWTDQVYGFDTTGTATNDKLNLPSKLIAGNTMSQVNGTNVGAIMSHSISGGVASFGSTDAGGATVLINAGNLKNAVAYLDANITAAGTAVAFAVDTDGNGYNDSLYVFEQTGVVSEDDTLIALNGVVGATLGWAQGQNVVQIVDTTGPTVNGATLTSNGLVLTCNEAVGGVDFSGLSVLKNGSGSNIATTTPYSGSTVTVNTSALAATDYVLIVPTQLDKQYATDAYGNKASLFDASSPGIALGGAGNNTVIDLSARTGNFEINAGSGNTIMTGTAGDNYIDGSTGSDTLNGGAGSDDLNGGANADVLNGGAGDDQLQGEAGADLLDGGDGADRFAFNQGDSTAVSFASGVYSFAGGAADVIKGSGFTVAGQNGDRVEFWSASQNIESPNAMGDWNNQNFVPSTPTDHLATDQEYFLERGTYDGSGAFTVNANGADTLVVYDGDASAVVSQTAFVISGVQPGQLTQNWNQIFLADTTAPVLQCATFSHNMVTLSYDEVLDGSNLPATGDFSVSANGQPVAVNSVAVNGKQISLGLANDISYSGPVAVTYTDAAGNDINAIQDTLGNDAASLNLTGSTSNTQTLVIGGEGDNVIDLSGSGDWNTRIEGNAGNDTLIGTSSSDVLVGGAGSDTLDGGWGNDAIFLDDGATRASDTVVVGIDGDSNPNWTDQVFGFDTTGTSTNDKLSLPSDAIAGDVSHLDGIDSGALAKHSIGSGIVSFENASNGTILINAGNLKDAVAYLDANIAAAGTAVAFAVDTDGNGSNDSLYVFEQTGVVSEDDTLIALNGVVGATLGTTQAQNVVQLVDTTGPTVNGATLNTNGLVLTCNETVQSVDFSGLSVLKNGAGSNIATSTTISGGSTVTINTSALAATDYVLIVPKQLDKQYAIDANGNKASLFDASSPGIALGGASNTLIDLSALNGNYELHAGNVSATLTGNADDNVIKGGVGSDSLNGGAGNDDLNGHANADVINGGAGDDQIQGGTGADTLDGGDGADKFAFSQGDSTAVSFAAGAYTFAGGAAEVIKGSGFTVAGQNGDRVELWNNAQDIQSPTPIGTPVDGLVTDQKYFLERGTYNGSGAFTVNANGADTLVVYDGDASAAVSQTAFVISGVQPGQLTQNGSQIFLADTGAPLLQYARFSHNTVTLSYDEALDGSHAPAAGAFTVDNNTVNSVSVSGNEISLNVANDISYSGPVAVSYTDAAGDDANAIQDTSGNDAASLSLTGSTSNTQTLVIGSDGANVIDLSNTGDWFTRIEGRGGNDVITGTGSDDVIVGGEGADTIDGGWDRDTIDLSESTHASDTVIFSGGGSSGSQPYFYDTVTGFDVSGSATNDKLNLPSKDVAADTTADFDGSDSGALAKHSIAGGIVTFKNSSGTTVLINTSNLNAATDYLIKNFVADGQTVAFQADTDNTAGADSLFVFQSSGKDLDNDVLVKLADVTGVTLGTAAATNVVQLVDTTGPTINGAELTSNGVKLKFNESIASADLAGITLQKGTGATLTTMTPVGSPSISGNTVTVSSGTTLGTTDYVLFTLADATHQSATDSSGNKANLLDYGVALAGSGGAVVNLSGLAAGKFDLEGGKGNDTLSANNNGDELYGNDGNDIINGGSGDGWMEGGTGADTMNGGGGAEGYSFTQGDSTVVSFNAGAGTYTFTGGADVIAGGFTVLASNGDSSTGDHIYLRSAMPGNGMSVMDSVPANGLTVDQSYFLQRGNYNAGVFTKNAAGADTLVVYDGNSLSGAVSQTALVIKGVIPSQLSASADSGGTISLINNTGAAKHLPTGSVVVTGTPAQGQTLTASNTLADADGLGEIGYQWRVGGNDIVGATASTFTLTAAQVGKTITVVASYIDGIGTGESVISSATAIVLGYQTGTDSADSLTGTDGNDSLIGGAGDDTLTGGVGNDTLIGNDGNDSLVGGVGNDSLVGGLGDDVYVVDSLSDAVVEAAASGADRVDTSLASYTLGANVENLRYTGAAAFAGVGNALDNVLLGGDGNDTLTGNAGNDILIGGAGNDSMVGGAGDDVYVVDSAGDTVVEAAASGTDRVETALSTYTLAANVENLVYTGAAAFAGTGNLLANSIVGAAGDDTLAGGAGNDTLTGNAGNDSLNGGGGTDSLVGGLGNDLYVVDVAGDVIVEASGEGADRVEVAFAAAGTYTLTDNVENAIVTGVVTGINITGNALDNALTGNALANVLLGAAGNDSLSGLAGNDTLDGGSGDDTLVGGLGDDVYKVDSALDVVTEDASAGTDRIETTLSSYSLTTLADVENLTYTGAAAFTGTGNAQGNSIAGAAGNDTLYGGDGNDTLTGNAGNDSLDGGAGNDSLVGGAGDDVYVVDSLSDSVVEAAASGTDRVETALSTHTLAANVENLKYTGSGAFAGTGNTLANSIVGASDNDTLNGGDGNDTLIGNAGNDSLSGGAGNDSLIGGAGDDALAGGLGDDVYVVDTLGDTVIEAAASGTDRIETTLSSCSLAALGNVENLTYTGTGAFAGTGNALNNALISGDGNDTLDGGAGTDSLAGGLGNDTYFVSVATDVVVEALNAGTDIVNVAFTAAGTYVLTSNVENASVTGSVAGINVSGNALNNELLGNEQANVLDGGAGNDTLDGWDGNDRLLGGAGDDLLHAGIGTDSVDGGDGSDTLLLLDSYDQYTLTRTETDIHLVNTNNTGEDITVRNVEIFSFVGGDMTLSDILDNSISDYGDVWVGTGESDSVDGGAGNDTLSGLAGDDTLIGGVGNDNVDGGDGDDTLIGGAGSDSLTGGQGADVYVVDVVSDVIVENADEGTDRVEVAFTVAGTYTLSANVENAAITTATAGVNITGNAADNTLTGNAVANTLTGNAGNDSLDGGAGNDTLLGGEGNDTLLGGIGTDSLVGGAGDDTYLLDVASDVVTEGGGAGEGTDLVILGFSSAGSYTMTAYVDNLTVMDGVAMAPVAVNVTGNGQANYITGNLAANNLAAGAGNDTIAGGGGNDVIDGGLDVDTVVFAGAATDYAITRPSTTQTTFTYLPDRTTTNLTNVEFIAFDNGNSGSLDLALLTAQIGSIGNDTLTGGGNDDTLAGGLGNDTLTGGGGNDDLQGGDGVDTLAGGDGNDILDGGAGSDVYLFGKGGGDDIIDQNDALPGSIDTIEIAINVAKYASGATVLTRGWHSYNDLVVTVNSTANGESLADHIVVNDFFLNDLVNNAGAIDQIRFATDNSLLSQAQIMSELLKGTVGDDWLRGYANTNDSISGLGGDDQMGGAAGNDTLDGGLGNDTLSGDEGNDSLLGGDGNDLLSGGAGNDTLSGDDGNDILQGGDGSDTYLFNVGNGQDMISDSGGDADVLSFSAGIRAATTHVSRSGNDLLVKFDSSSEQVQITDYFAGGLVEQFRFAEGGTWSSTAILAKVLVPTNGDDYLVGYLGSELLQGLAGNDTIDGRAGNDTINGGLGSDLLTGGAGADRFVFDNLDAPDTITDFTSGTDKIALSKAVFGLTGAVGATTNLAGLGSTFAYHADTGALTYDADGVGGSDPFAVALIGLGKSLGNDFLLVA